MAKQKKDESLVLVEALQLGYYGEERRYPGEKFAMKTKDFFYHGKDGKRVIEKAEDEETGEEFDAYKTCSWVELVEENYDPYAAAEAEKAPVKKKIRIGPQDSVFPPPKPLSLEPQSPNPEGFAKAPVPVKAAQAHSVDKDAEAPVAKKVPVHAPAQPTAKPAADKNKSDDVI